MNNGYYPFSIRQGSKWDFVGAWTMRLLGTLIGAAILWSCKMIFAAVMYLVNTLPPMQADVSTLKRDVADLKVAQQESKAALKTAADTARKELMDAEQRVKQELTEQLKKGRTITNQNRQP